jgi:rhamnosyltransferase
MTDSHGLAAEVAPKPHVAVLLATYNGATWLREQLDSILIQRGVRVAIHASDDGSTDATDALLRTYEAQGRLVRLPPVERLGNANRNFMRLIQDADIGDADFAAFADQDDLWNDDKLERAIQFLSGSGAHAYSGDVTAFWPDGRERVLEKSQPQREYDYLFEAPGPGCTFVFTRSAFLELRAWVRSHAGRVRQAKAHDWLIYAYARVHGWRWTLDTRPGLLYRQHDRNEVGANVGRAAARARFAHLRNGGFRRDALFIAELVGDDSPMLAALRRLNLLDRLRLALAFRSLRRRWRDALVMIAFALLTR